MLDIGLFLLRVVVGLLLVGHGVQKLTRRFGGKGVAAHAAYLDQLGYRWSRKMAVGHGVAEVAAGALLVLGLWLPLATALIVAVMINAAITVHGSKGLWVADGGYEYPLVLAVVATTLAFTGGGAYALGAALGWEATPLMAMAGVLAGLILGGLVLVSRVRPQGQTTTPRSHDDGLRAA